MIGRGFGTVRSMMSTHPPRPVAVRLLACLRGTTQPILKVPGDAVRGMLLVWIVLVLAATGCQSGEAGVGVGEPVPGPRVAAVRSEPTVRVRVAREVEAAEFGHANQLVSVVSVNARGERSRPLRVRGPMGVTLQPGTRPGFVISSGGRPLSPWPAAMLEISSGDASPIRVGESAYPGTLRLTPTGGGGIGEAKEFDVVNILPIEHYLPGVLAGELPADWGLEAYKAQAVAARSYALWELQLRPERAWDLEATTASQMYEGVSRRPVAEEAVRATRGEVLVHRGRVVPAFYSSTGGGTQQDAAAAFPGRVPDIEPLRGRQGEDRWDDASPRARWGPVTRDATELARRIAAWGAERGHPVAAITPPLTRVSVSRRGRTGRPAMFDIVDGTGRTYSLKAEDFRFAANHSGPPLEREDTLWSSHFDVAVAGNRVVFSKGRGFGHGVGLSQFGAQGMAAAGRGYVEILHHYYPGAEVRAVYR